MSTKEKVLGSTIGSAMGSFFPVDNYSVICTDKLFTCVILFCPCSHLCSCLPSSEVRVPVMLSRVIF